MTLRHASALGAAVLLAACGGDSKPKKEDPLPPAVVDCKAGSSTVTGTFTSPNGEVPIAGGLVTIASAPGCTGSTSGTGEFELQNVPMAATTVTVTRGRFHGTAPVTPGTPVVVHVPADSVKIAHVPGAYDAIEAVVARLGFTSTELLMGELGTTSLADYDLILLNCGLDEDYLGDADVKAKLTAWVTAGGLLYASDYAGIYVDGFWGGKVKYLSPDPYQGVEGFQTATVSDESLARALGKTTAEINFDLPGWYVVNGVGAGTRVLLSGPVETYDVGDLTGKPYAVQFASGAGRVTYTSFHEEAQTTADMDTLLEQMVFGL